MYCYALLVILQAPGNFLLHLAQTYYVREYNIHMRVAEHRAATFESGIRLSKTKKRAVRNSPQQAKEKLVFPDFAKVRISEDMTRSWPERWRAAKRSLH